VDRSAEVKSGVRPFRLGAAAAGLCRFGGAWRLSAAAMVMLGLKGLAFEVAALPVVLLES
jgi:hypothetical protein